jgi:hypothetical protein
MKKISYTEAKERIQNINPKIEIDEKTYVNMSTKCLMVEDPYGEFWCKPNSITSGKQKGHHLGSKTKSIQTCKEKYGTDHSFQSDTVKQKIKKTMIERYGTENPMHIEEAKEKMQNTNIERYGVKNPMQNRSIRQKTENTNRERYGCANPLQNSVILAKQEKTNMERYGGKSSMHSEEVYKKNLRSGRSITVLRHWKTEEEILCRGSYEVRVVEYFNLQKIDFAWQIRFILPNGKIYVCDAYLPLEDKYIEIKGFWRNDALEKWKIFQIMQPNSELWDKAKLRSMKILP